MAIDFPNSPTIGQTYTSTTGQTYTWNGTAWRVLVPGSQMSRTVFTATAGQTTFSMNYTPGFIDVYLNGVKLVNGADFTATSATTIVLANACNVGDTLEVMSIAQVAYTDAAKAEDVYSVVRGMKNRIINGDMRIDQRNAGASVTPTSEGFALDRWTVRLSASSKYSVQQNAGAVAPPAGYTNYLGVTSLSAYSVGSSDYFGIQQNIEGFNIADFGWGSAGALPATLSFWVRSSLTGTFSCSLYNNSGSVSIPLTYTISAANTWQFVTLPIPSSSIAGTFTSTTNGLGITVFFNLGCGSGQSGGTVGVWGTTFARAATGATSIVGTNGATFYLTGVQLEAGTVTNPVFERRPYGLELMLCQRFYEKSYDIGTAPGTATSTGVFASTGVQGATTTGSIWAGTTFKVAKRASPTLTFWDAQGNLNKVNRVNPGAADNFNSTVTWANSFEMSFFVNSGSGNAGSVLQYHWTASAEL